MKPSLLLRAAIAVTACTLSRAAEPAAPFNGLGMNLGNVWRLSPAKTRSISPENPTGEKGKGGMATEGASSFAASNLGQGWKVSPRLILAPGQMVTMAEIQGAGAIQHMWITFKGNFRAPILRMYWDGEKDPSVEAPVGDFFGQGWGVFSQLSSLPVTVNPGNGFNSYWEMPFRKSARITLTNTGDEEMILFFQIDYTLTEIPADAAYFHAQFRRVNPLSGGVYTILDGVKGRGQYVGTYMAWGANTPGWWGEGEIKFYLDGDGAFPTICGTGTEDYFCGSYAFKNKATKQYQEFTTAYAGMHQVLGPGGVGKAYQRFGMYRWHITDPIRFEQDLRVTIQALGWGKDKRYRLLEDDLASVAYWYQTEPHAPFPKLPSKEALEVDVTN